MLLEMSTTTPVVETPATLSTTRLVASLLKFVSTFAVDFRLSDADRRTSTQNKIVFDATPEEISAAVSGGEFDFAPFVLSRID